MILTRNLRSLTKVEAAELLGKVEGLQAAVGVDGVLVAMGEMPLIRQVAELCDALEKRQLVSYVVQVHLVEVRDELLSDLGIDVQPLAQVTAAGLAQATGERLTATWAARAEVEALLRAASTDKRAAVVIDPVLCVVAGMPGTHSDQVRYPVQTGTRDGQTGQVDQGVQFIPVGLRVTVTVVPLREGYARLSVTVNDGQVQGETEAGNPVISEREFTTALDVPCGEVVLIGSMRRQVDESAGGKWLKWGRSRERSDRQWVLACELVQVTT